MRMIPIELAPRSRSMVGQVYRDTQTVTAHQFSRCGHRRFDTQRLNAAVQSHGRAEAGVTPNTAVPVHVLTVAAICRVTSRGSMPRRTFHEWARRTVTPKRSLPAQTSRCHSYRVTQRSNAAHTLRATTLRLLPKVVVSPTFSRERKDNARDTRRLEAHSSHAV